LISIASAKAALCSTSCSNPRARGRSSR